MRRTRSLRSAAFAVLLILCSTLSAAVHADPVPGDACGAANAFVWSGGPEEAGKVYLMTCQGGVWVRVVETDTSGNVGIRQATPAAPLDVNGAVKLGTSAQICDGTLAGGLRWNGGSSCVDFCNGANWACTSGGACDAAPTTFDFTDAPNVTTSTLTASNILSIVGTDSGCNSTVSVSGDGSPQYRVCSDAGCSSEVQTWTSSNLSIAMFGRYLQVRTSSASTNGVAHNVTVTVGGVSNVWTVTTGSVGACGATPSPGDICSDGTVYAGVSPDGNKHMYVARCDISMSWDGSACTGGPGTRAWNDGNSDWTMTGVTGIDTGAANTAALIGIDSNSVTGGVQPHNAAQACADETAHSHSDWYLPALTELLVIYENLVDGVPNDNNPDPLIPGFTTGSYWTSAESSSNIFWARVVPFTNGAGGQAATKNGIFSVRCARMD